MSTIRNNYMNPYLAGFLLGMVLLASYVIAGRGLGASGAARSVVVTTVASAAPEYAEKSPFYAEYFTEVNPMGSWLVFLVVGLILGAFLSGAMANRLRFATDRGPNITVRTRMFFALGGGLLFGLGAQFGRGCTSGSALSGMAVLSTGGMLTMMAIFGTGYLIAYFFRKLWI
ncbi:MAG: hypothetical protein EA394_07710 [Bacteroidia bacterium]|nr:MAG: hypothetical protein EA394_07710 [Bacteroidia bacterium]